MNASAYCMQAEDHDSERDEDEGSLAAFGCLGALSTVLESVSSLPHLFPALEPVVFPILQRLCTQEGQDVYEEIMEILSYFTFFSPEVRIQILLARTLKGISVWEAKFTI